MKAPFKDDDATSKTTFPQQKAKKTHFFQQPIKTLWILIAYKTHQQYIYKEESTEKLRGFLECCENALVYYASVL